MALTTDEKKIIANKFSKIASTNRDELAVTKSDLRDAMGILDQYFDDNASAINNLLPAAVKTGLTTKQKAKLLMLVTEYRFIK